jgi:hypothetical protein
MKKGNFIQRMLLKTFVTGLFCYLLINLSGCEIGPGPEPHSTVEAICSEGATIEGPDVIFFDPCETNDVTYKLFVGGSELNSNTPQGAGLEWSISQELTKLSALDPGPIVVQANQPGKATITLKGPAVPDGACPADEGSKLRTYATKTITILSSQLQISSTVCGLPGSGKVTVLDPVPGGQNYQWSISPAGIANITPKPGTPDCFVDNAQGDFIITVQKIGNKCNSTPVSADVKITPCK